MLDGHLAWQTLDAVTKPLPWWEFGIAGLVMGAVMAVVIGPLVRSALRQQSLIVESGLRQQSRALDLLERSVEKQSEAVVSFQMFAARLEETQGILLRRIEDIANQGPREVKT